MKTKIISDEAYLQELEHLEAEDEEKKRKKINRAANKKIKYSKEDQEDKDIEDDVKMRNDAHVDAFSSYIAPINSSIHVIQTL